MLRRIRYSKVVDNSLIRQLSSQKCGFKKIAVVGLGLMGHGIAQITAEAGYEVLAIEAQDKALFSGMKRINESLKKSLTKGKSSGTLTEAQVISQQNEIVSRIKTTTKIEDAHDCDLIIEAIEENMDVKLDFYRRLGPLIKPSAIFGSNTSSLPMTTMAMASGNFNKRFFLRFLSLLLSLPVYLSLPFCLSLSTMYI
jgi:3-hydroxyacyl-CoA dehydrogenase